MLVAQFCELVDLARCDALTAERRFDLEAVAAALQNRLRELPLEQIIEFSDCYYNVLHAAAHTLAGKALNWVLTRGQLAAGQLNSMAYPRRRREESAPLEFDMYRW